MQAIIYIKVIGEPTEVWRPTEGEWINGNKYKVMPIPYNLLTDYGKKYYKYPYDTSYEEWEFIPGEIVQCEWFLNNGIPILKAVEKVNES